jgi:hypothetical protein
MEHRSHQAARRLCIACAMGEAHETRGLGATREDRLGRMRRSGRNQSFGEHGDSVWHLEANVLAPR